MLYLKLAVSPIRAQKFCSDVPGWTDKDGFSCDWYGSLTGTDDSNYYEDQQSQPRCEVFGNCCFNQGHTAITACCVCNGGTNYDECIDVTINEMPWADAEGDSCEAYDPALNSVGDDDSYYDDGDTWCSYFGTDYENNGFTASTACCICGGGVRNNIPEVTPPSVTAAPTKAEATASPTKLTTPSPTVAQTNKVTTVPDPATAPPTSSITASPTKIITSSPTQVIDQTKTAFPTIVSNTSSPTDTANTASPTKYVTLAPTKRTDTVSPTIDVQTSRPTLGGTLSPSNPLRKTSSPTISKTLTPTKASGNTSKPTSELKTSSPTIMDETSMPTLFIGTKPPVMTKPPSPQIVIVNDPKPAPPTALKPKPTNSSGSKKSSGNKSSKSSKSGKSSKSAKSSKSSKSGKSNKKIEVNYTNGSQRDWERRKI